MAQGSVELNIAGKPDEVWALVGNFGGVADIMPVVESCTIEGDDRVLAMLGLEVRERLVSRDDAARSLTYSVIAGVPLESHQATISVAPDGDGSVVTWAFSVAPDEMAPIFEDTYRSGLGELAKKFA
jgi:mxaD protein